MSEDETALRYALYALHRGENAEPAALTRRAARAEAAGFEALWVGDHVALPADAPDPADEPRLEALATLAFLAGATTRIRLGVGVLVLPQRHPVLLAKQLTSIDVLSGGRLTVGIGVGHVEAELGAFGVPLAERGARTDEHLAALLALWSGEDRYEGRWVRFAGLTQYPPTVQRPRPPIVVGGHGRVAFERAARAADGWFGWELEPHEVAEAVAALGSARARLGGDGAPPLEISVAPRGTVTPALADAYAAAGTDRLVLVPDQMTGRATDALIDHAATHLIP